MEQAGERTLQIFKIMKRAISSFIIRKARFKVISYILSQNVNLNPKRAGSGSRPPPSSTFRAVIPWDFFFAPRAFLTSF